MYELVSAHLALILHAHLVNPGVTIVIKFSFNGNELGYYYYYYL